MNNVRYGREAGFGEPLVTFQGGMLDRRTIAFTAVESCDRDQSVFDGAIGVDGHFVALTEFFTAVLVKGSAADAAGDGLFVSAG